MTASVTGGEKTASLESGLMEAYEIRSLYFRYGASRSASRPWVLEDLNCSIQCGEIFTIVGPNGSGKTSLLKLLARIVPVQHGSIMLYGQPLRELQQEDVARSVAYVPQDTQQIFPFTVSETVLMGRFPHRHRARWDFGFGWESQDDRAVAQQAMKTMNVWHLAKRPVTELSGGERQRVIIARALAQNPRVLMLDEPTAFLDLQYQIESCALLCRLKQERGLTIVMVSHDLNLASQYSDRILLLDRGRLVRLGGPQDVIEPEVLEAVYRCRVLVDEHPVSKLPRVTLPGRTTGFGAGNLSH
ncbi:MAG TPA: ABC transporter ATP-binding protein [Nitrospira sp.]|nr:ABC transporter ATP-binding protein [Nitrospira sp.]